MNLIKALRSIIWPGLEYDKDGKFEAKRIRAYRYLKQAIKSDITKLVVSLIEVFENPDHDSYVRMSAAHQLMILASSGASVKGLTAEEQWRAYNSVAQLPENQWPGVISTMTRHVLTSFVTKAMKVVVFEGISEMYRNMGPFDYHSYGDFLPNQTNDILTAVIHGMSEQSNWRVIVAATDAFLDGFECLANYENDFQMNLIMSELCKVDRSSNEAWVNLLICLQQIVLFYYNEMGDYAYSFCAIAMEAMESDDEDVACEGMEFWSKMAYEESTQSRLESKFYAKSALPILIPNLTTILVKHAESEPELWESEHWKPDQHAGYCLYELVSCCEDDAIARIVPFICENLNHEDWRHRKATVVAIHSIVQEYGMGSAEPTELLKDVVKQIFPKLIELRADEEGAIRYTVAFKRTLLVVFKTKFSKYVLNTLLKHLFSETTVAANTAWAIGRLCEATYKVADF